MPTTDRELPQVVVNKLTQAQYNSATKSQDEFYLVTDAKIDTVDIADGAITSAKIDWSTLGDQSSYIDLGAIRICFGSVSVTSIPTGAFGEKAQAITFPASFASTPMVFAQAGDMSGGCGEYVSPSSISTSGATLWCGHAGSTSGTSMNVSWLAVGAKA